MRVATRIVAGFGTLIALATLVLVYQVVLIHRLLGIQEELAVTDFRAAEISHDLIRHLERIEENIRASRLVPGPGAAGERNDLQREIASHLEALAGLELSPAERVELGRLRGFWVEWEGMLAGLLRTRPEADSGQLADEVGKLQSQARSLYEATLGARRSDLERGNETARRGRWIAAAATVIALALSLAVSLLVLRSISDPLRHLTEGTRAMTEGKFFYRLDTSRADEFAQLAKDFNALATRLDELTAMTKGFVAHVAHDLEAPLASIQEAIHLLREEIAGPLSAKQRGLLELSYQSSHRLAAMLANLLDLSHHEAGAREYDTSPQDLVPLTTAAVRQLESAAAQKGIRVACDLPATPATAGCDPARMLRVIGNLLDNAVRFAPSGSVVEVVLRRVEVIPADLPAVRRASLAVAAGRDYVLLTLADRGPGIPDAFRQNLFESFQRATPNRGTTTRELPGQGIGIGLAVSSIIVEAHRGALWFTDNPGGGSVLKLMLPAVPAHAAAADASGGSEPSSAAVEPGG